MSCSILATGVYLHLTEISYYLYANHISYHFKTSTETTKTVSFFVPSARIRINDLSTESRLLFNTACYLQNKIHVQPSLRVLILYYSNFKGVWRQQGPYTFLVLRAAYELTTYGVTTTAAYTTKFTFNLAAGIHLANSFACSYTY